MDYQQQQYQQYAQSDPNAPPPSYDQSYNPYYAPPYPQPVQPPPYDPSAAYTQQYYDYSAAYGQPPPPGVEADQLQYMGPPSADFSQYPDFDPAQAGGNRGGFRGRRGNFGNSRGRGRGRGNRAPAVPKPPPVPKPPKQPKPHAWCDICRVDCNSLDILEQHKSGKKHKKTVQRLQEYEYQQQQLAGYQSTLPITQLPVPVNPIPVEPNLPPAIKEENVEVKTEPEVANQDPNLPVVNQEQNVSDGIGLSSAYGFGTRLNNNNNNINNNSGGRRGNFANPRGKKQRRFGEFQGRVRPIVCTLCNVNCDTPAVFETHLTGKKHVGKVNRFQGSNMIFGPITVYIPPGQQSLLPSGNFVEPIFYGLTTPEMVQQHEMLVKDEIEGENNEEIEGGNNEGNKDLGENTRDKDLGENKGDNEGDEGLGENEGDKDLGENKGDGVVVKEEGLDGDNVTIKEE